MQLVLTHYLNYSQVGLQIIIRRECDPVFCLRELRYHGETKYYYWEYIREFKMKLDAIKFAYDNGLEFIDEKKQNAKIDKIKKS